VFQQAESNRNKASENDDGCTRRCLWWFQPSLRSRLTKPPVIAGLGFGPDPRSEQGLICFNVQGDSGFRFEFVGCCFQVSLLLFVERRSCTKQAGSLQHQRRTTIKKSNGRMRKLIIHSTVALSSQQHHGINSSTISTSSSNNSNSNIKEGRRESTNRAHLVVAGNGQSLECGTGASFECFARLASSGADCRRGAS